MLKNKKGITLIALVVTIVVLLILAGVSISLILDNNGIIEKSKESRLETRASQVEDEIGLWKQNNFIKSETGESIENANAVLQSLLSRKLLNEDEIDRENEIITIKRNDGSILKQIEYGNVKINISKTPTTEKAALVILKVESVEGITIPNIDLSDGREELNDFINSLNLMSEEQKKDMIKQILPKAVNKAYDTNEYDTFEKALVKLNLKPEGYDTIDTEEKLWTFLKENNVFNEFIVECCMGPFYDKESKRIIGYIVTNPDNENSDTYIATENGTYIFKIEDIVTGKEYTKKVEVTNIGENDKYYIANIKETDISNNIAQVNVKMATTNKIKLASRPCYWCVGLREKESNELQIFTKAYIVYDNQKIDISSEISEKNGYSYIIGDDIEFYLYKSLENNFDRNEFYGSEQQFIIEKDGVEYRGYAKVCEEVE